MARLERPHLGAHGGYRAYNLVAGNERILADSPVIGNQMEVAMTDSAMGNRDFHFVQTQLAGVVLEGQ
jgi:hypothetical protein